MIVENLMGRSELGYSSGLPNGSSLLLAVFGLSSPSAFFFLPFFPLIAPTAMIASAAPPPACSWGPTEPFGMGAFESGGAERSLRNVCPPKLLRHKFFGGFGWPFRAT
eukprot:1524823-Prymnesium_polylepis.1